MSSAVADSLLLRDFATTRSQESFRQLVDRYHGLVFGTAQRRLGEADTAGEVTQQVFIALARKAAWLAGRATVGGWLYKATLLECLRHQRQDSRRRERERRYAEESMIHEAHPTATDDGLPALGELTPWLDEELARLPADDREALLLRYFRGLSLRETGQALGTTEEAARKRISRALEKLSARGRKRGVSLSGSALGLGLAALTAKASAPAAAVSQISAAATAAAGPPSAAALLYLQALALSKVQVATLCLLGAAAPVAYQTHRVQQASAEAAMLRERLAELEGGRPASSATMPVVNVPPAPRPVPATESPRRTDRPKDDDERRARWGKWMDLQRRQKQAARLQALTERLGLDARQRAAVGDILSESETQWSAVMDEARRAGGGEAMRTALQGWQQNTEAAIEEVLGEEQRAAYDAYVGEEVRNQQEVQASRRLGELQSWLPLEEAQKDRLFTYFFFSSSGLEGEWRPGPDPIVTDPTQLEPLRDILTPTQFHLVEERSQAWAEIFAPADQAAEKKPAPPPAPAP